jgi:hypothetical protein
MRTGLPCLAAVSTMAPNWRSFFSLKPTLPGVDAILVERLGAGRMIGQELVADIVEVADDRHVHADLEQPLLDVRNRSCRLVAVDGNAHDLGTRARQRRHLSRGSLDIGGIGIGHGLHDDRRSRRRPSTPPTSTATERRRSCGPASVIYGLLWR